MLSPLTSGRGSALTHKIPRTFLGTAHATFKTWTSVLNTTGSKPNQTDPNNLLSSLPLLIPDLDISKWKSSGRNLVNQLYEWQQMLSFQDLAETYGISHKDLYKYDTYYPPLALREDALMKSIYSFFSSENLIKKGCSWCTMLYAPDGYWTNHQPWSPLNKI